MMDENKVSRRELLTLLGAAGTAVAIYSAGGAGFRLRFQRTDRGRKSAGNECIYSEPPAWYRKASQRHGRKSRADGQRQPHLDRYRSALIRDVARRRSRVQFGSGNRKCRRLGMYTRGNDDLACLDRPVVRPARRLAVHLSQVRIPVHDGGFDRFGRARTYERIGREWNRRVPVRRPLGRIQAVRIDSVAGVQEQGRTEEGISLSPLHRYPVNLTFSVR